LNFKVIGQKSASQNRILADVIATNIAAQCRKSNSCPGAQLLFRQAVDYNYANTFFLQNPSTDLAEI